MPGGLRDIAGKTLVFIISFLCCFPGPGKLKSGQGNILGVLYCAMSVRKKPKDKSCSPELYWRLGFYLLP